MAGFIYYQANFTVVATAVTVAPASTQLVYPGATGLTITVADAGTPTGAVRVYDGTTALATVQLGAAGQAYWYITPGLNAGTHQISAAYSGDAHNPAVQSQPVTISVSPAPVTLAASCGSSSFAYARNYACSVTASSAWTTPGGTVTYSLDTNPPVGVPLANGAAMFSISHAVVGNHTVVISYGSQGNYAAAVPVTEPFTVTQAQSKVVVTPSSLSLKTGSQLKLSASVTCATAAAPAVGTVTFLDNEKVIGQAKVNSQGQAAFTVNKIATGIHLYVARYSGTTNYSAATSKAVQVTVF